MANDQEALKLAVAEIQSAKETVLSMIPADTYGMIRITVESDFNRMLNRLAFVAGTPMSSGGSVTQEFKPVTNFMGEELQVKTDKPLSEEVSPKDTEIQIFLKKVEELKASIDIRKNKDILDSFTQPNDLLVIRGLAKQAGLEDFRTAEINSEYLDLIRAALKENDESQQTEKETRNSVIITAADDFKEE